MNTVSKFGSAYAVLGDPSIDYIYKLEKKTLLVKSNETYQNLGKKIAIALFWTSQQTLEKFDFLIKADTDTIFCHNLADKHLFRHRHGLIYGGVFNNGFAPYTEGKWKDVQFQQVFKRDIYSKYAYGGGYILSNRLVKKVAHVIQKYSFDSFEGILEDALVGHLVYLISLEHIVYYKNLNAITAVDTIDKPQDCTSHYVFQHKVLHPVRYMIA